MHATSSTHRSPAARCAAPEGQKQTGCSCHRGKHRGQRQAHCAPQATPHLRTTWDTLEMPASSAASAESVTALTCSSHALLAAATLLSSILAAQGGQGRAEGVRHSVELGCQPAAAGRPVAQGSAQVPRRSTVGLASAPSHPTQAAGLSKRLKGSDAAATVRPRRRRRAGAPNPRAWACAGLPTCVCLNGAQAEAAAAAATLLLAAAGVGHGVLSRAIKACGPDPCPGPQRKLRQTAADRGEQCIGRARQQWRW